MTLDERIERDLTELYEGKEISCAKDLQAVIEISAKGLPQHFVGDRNAKTVFVQLNPGQEPATDFCLCDGEQVEEVYAYCNLHGLWKC